MNKKKGHITKEKKPFSNKKAAILSATLVVVVISGFLLFRIFLQNSAVRFSLKAAIVDQLGQQDPNPDFNETGVVASILRNAGFTVSYYRSETVNVAFFKGLAKNDFGLIVLRAHAATREGEAIVDIFTSEEFSDDNYRSEQDDGLLTRGYYSWVPGKYYFAITPKFIENLEGSFPNSVVIAMGCNTMNETCTEMAEAFIKKGAKAYVGWTGLVGYSHTDNETIKLLTRFLVENRTLDYTISRVEFDPDFGSTMKYYPQEAGNLRISDLTKDARASIALQVTANSFEPLRTCDANLIKRQTKMSDLCWTTLTS